VVKTMKKEGIKPPEMEVFSFIKPLPDSFKPDGSGFFVARNSGYLLIL